MTQDNQEHLTRTTTGLVPGLIVAGLGVLFLLGNLNIVQIYNWWQLWPVIVIAIGLAKLVDSTAHHEKAVGAVMIVIGGIILASTLGWFSWQIWDLWPVALIGIGLVMLFQRLGYFEESLRWNFACPQTGTDGTAVFSGFKRRVTGDYHGANYFAMFGGGEVNLRQAEMQADAALIHVTAIFGGIEFKVPPNWLVINETVGIFGGSDDKTVQPSPDGPGVKRLVVRGEAIFGGISIRN